MSTIHLHQTTTSTPEQYIAGLTDFGPGRSKLFGNSADEYLKVHHRGRSEADVTEGSGGIWERLHHDWSDPNRVVLKTTDSNVWGGASGHTYTFTRQPNGTTDEHYQNHSEPAAQAALARRAGAELVRSAGCARAADSVSRRLLSDFDSGFSQGIRSDQATVRGGQDFAGGRGRRCAGDRRRARQSAAAHRQDLSPDRSAVREHAFLCT